MEAYSLSTVTPAATAVVSLVDAKSHLVVDHCDDDKMIERLVRAATTWVERRIARNLAKTVFLVQYYGFSDVITLPRGPVQEVVSITYLDSDNAEQTLASSQYELDAPQGVIRPAYDIVWPDTVNHWSAVRVTYAAGYYDSTASPLYEDSAIPDDLRSAVLLVLGDLYEHREAKQDMQLYGNDTVEMLVEQYRIITL